MLLQSLGYVGVGASALEDWRAYGSNLLGMQLIDKSSSTLAFRMDDRKQRLVVDSGTDGVRFFGWEVEDAAAVDRLAARVSNAGVDVMPMTAALASQRHVSGGVTFVDPAGYRMEVFHGPEIAASSFAPGRNISGFRTGPLGMGHVVLTVERIDLVLPFYLDILGFHISDYMDKPFKAVFMHTNGRHHSLALAEVGKAGQMHHLMVELFDFDDVGQGYDLAQTDSDRVAVSLGRHSNDLMTSFYTNTPSKFFVEYGWGGREIDPETWKPFELTDGPSLWGHDRAWMTPEARVAARKMCIDAAERGARAPVQVLPGNHVIMPSACAWWDHSKGT